MTRTRTVAQLLSPRGWLGAELGVPARTVSRILHRHQLPCLDDCDPLTGQPIRSSKHTACRYEKGTGPES